MRPAFSSYYQASAEARYAFEQIRLFLTKITTMKLQLISLCFFTCYLSVFAFAQIGVGPALLGYDEKEPTVQDVARIKSAPIIVLLYNEDQGETQALKTDRSVIAKQNDALRNAMENFWPYGNNITYKSIQEYKEMKTKPANAIVIGLTHIKMRANETPNVQLQFDPAEFDFENDFSTGTNMLALTIAPIEDMDVIRTYVNRALATIMLPQLITEEYEVISALKCATYIFDETVKSKTYNIMESGKDHTAEIKDQKLVFLDSYWNDEDLKGIYPFAYEVVPAGDFETIIKEKKQGYAYCILLFGLPVILSAETNQVYYFPTKADIYKSNTKGRLAEKNLSEIVKRVNKEKK